MKNIVILISGRGSNMEAIVRACADERWDARIAAVVSNRADAAGLAFARERGIAAEVVDHRAFATRDAFDDALAECIDAPRRRHRRAGRLHAHPRRRVRAPLRRTARQHPSVAAAGVPGPGDAPARDRGGLQGERRDVHFVTAELDHGPIIAQAVVPVLAGDDEAALSARVLAQEHRLYPRAIAWLVEGRLERRDGVVRHRDGAAQLLLPDEAAR